MLRENNPSISDSYISLTFFEIIDQKQRLLRLSVWPPMVKSKFSMKFEVCPSWKGKNLEQLIVYLFNPCLHKVFTRP